MNAACVKPQALSFVVAKTNKQNSPSFCSCKACCVFAVLLLMRPVMSRPQVCSYAAADNHYHCKNRRYKIGSFSVRRQTASCFLQLQWSSKSVLAAANVIFEQQNFAAATREFELQHQPSIPPPLLPSSTPFSLPGTCCGCPPDLLGRLSSVGVTWHRVVPVCLVMAKLRVRCPWKLSEEILHSCVYVLHFIHRIAVCMCCALYTAQLYVFVALYTPHSCVHVLRFIHLTKTSATYRIASFLTLEGKKSTDFFQKSNYSRTTCLDNACERG